MAFPEDKLQGTVSSVRLLQDGPFEELAATIPCTTSKSNLQPVGARQRLKRGARRRSVQNLMNGFESLRTLLPGYTLFGLRQTRREILVSAAQYIRDMTELLKERSVAENQLAVLFSPEEQEFLQTASVEQRDFLYEPHFASQVFSAQDMPLPANDAPPPCLFPSHSQTEIHNQSCSTTAHYRHDECIHSNNISQYAHYWKLSASANFDVRMQSSSNC